MVVVVVTADQGLHLHAILFNMHIGSLENAGKAQATLTLYTTARLSGPKSESKPCRLMMSQGRCDMVLTSYEKAGSSSTNTNSQQDEEEDRREETAVAAIEKREWNNYDASVFEEIIPEFRVAK